MTNANADEGGAAEAVPEEDAHQPALVIVGALRMRGCTEERAGS